MSTPKERSKILIKFSEADQKKNPNAVVTALKFYAASMKEQERAKFMTTNSVYNQSDEDIDDVEIQLTGQVTEHLRELNSSSGSITLAMLPSGSVSRGLSVPSSDNSLSERIIPSPAPSFQHNGCIVSSRTESQYSDCANSIVPPLIHPRSTRRDPPPPPPQRVKANVSFDNGTLTPGAAPKIPPKVPPKPAITVLLTHF
uniref:Ras-associating domain-containing protein n=1 Tax=Heterorhabditis bacteriophora TaxID=37862 RepID=A0A1I7XDS6_HETBA